MINKEFSQYTESIYSLKYKTLLIVGPKPPPVGGASVTVKVISEELTKYPVDIEIINTSPFHSLLNKRRDYSYEKIFRMIFVLHNFITKIQKCDAVLVLANNFFIFSMVGPLLFTSRLFRKPFYLKPVGGDFDLFLEKKSIYGRNFILWVLKKTNGIFLQTQQLSSIVSKYGCSNSHYLPGLRQLLPTMKKKKKNSINVKLIFLAHIMREKGVFILLKALQILFTETKVNVSCDFYGPIYNEIKREFLNEIGKTPNARYCGIVDAGSGSGLIANYDVLVLPTFFSCEGHPGAIIEAMHAGVPVISTIHRAIPELIFDGINGLLVPIKDSQALSKAICKMSLDKNIRQKMGNENYNLGKRFNSEIVIEQLVKIIFPDLSFGSKIFIKE